MGKRKILIIASSSIVGLGLGYFIYTKFRNKAEIKRIHKILDGASGAYGSLEDFSDVFTGSNYVNKMKSKYKNLILLKDSYVEGFRKQLHGAIAGAGTNEEVIKAVFNKLKDRVHVAQVAESYKKAYNEKLLTAIRSDIDDDDSEMRELVDIMSKKPAFRVNR